MRRTAPNRLLLGLLGCILGGALALALAVVSARGLPAQSQPAIQGQVIPVPLTAFRREADNAMTGTATLALPTGQPRAAYSTTVQAPFDFTDFALFWQSTVTPSLPLTSAGTLPPPATVTATLPITPGSPLSATLPTAEIAPATETVPAAPPVTATLPITGEAPATPAVTDTTPLTTGGTLHALGILAQEADTATPEAAPATTESAPTGEPATSTPTPNSQLLTPNPQPPAPILVEVRTGPDGTTWGEWQPALPDDVSDPTMPLTSTAGSLIAVPQGGPAARYVQVRVTLQRGSGALPEVTGLDIGFINAGTATATPPPQPTPNPPATNALPPPPGIVSRTGWGSPDGAASPAWPPLYRRAHHIILNQIPTAPGDTNFAARVRALWYYDAQMRGWGDIGYNYLVDPQGTVYEGRAGGNDVVGHHSYPFDVGSVGVGLLGVITDTPPSGLVSLLAWATAEHGLAVNESTEFTGVLACADTVTYTRPAIAAHGEYQGVGCGGTFNPADRPAAVGGPFLAALRGAVIAGAPEYRVRFLDHQTPPQMVAETIVTTSVTVQNLGSVVWPEPLPMPVHLAYHWADAGGTRLEGVADDLRNPLPRDMGYGDTARLTAQVRVPITPGNYLLRWDMVHELKTWFEDAGTSLPLTVPVTVVLTDSTPPTSTIVGLLPITNKTRFPVDWTASDPDGAAITGTDVQYRAMPEGTWVDWQTGVTTTEALFDGGAGYTYAFRSRATDAAGNTAPWPEQPQALITVDVIPPALTVVSPTDGLRVEAGSVLVRGTTDPGALVTVNGGAAPVMSGTFTATLQAAVPDLAIRVRATDAAGNVTERALAVLVGGPVLDVAADAPNAAAMMEMVNRGILSPDAARHFTPDGRISRAQLAAALATAFGWTVQADAQPRFSDVAADNPLRAAVETAARNDVMTGYSDGKFYPDDPVARDQTVKAIVAAAKWPLLTGPTSPFPDVPQTDWAYPYLETAYRHGVLGTTAAPGPFRPRDFVTRAELSAMLYYALGDLAGK